MDNQKGFSPILLVVIIAIALGGGFVVYQRQTTKPSSTPTFTPVPTSIPINAPIPTPTPTQTVNKYTTGLYGKVTLLMGDCAPKVGQSSSCQSKPVSRTIYVRDLSTREDRDKFLDGIHLTSERVFDPGAELIEEMLSSPVGLVVGLEGHRA